jgi:hypothetical protein
VDLKISALDHHFILFVYRILIIEFKNYIFYYSLVRLRDILSTMETYKIPMALRAAYLSMYRQTNAHLAPYGVTVDQFVYLHLLIEEDGIIQQELVKRATSDPNTMRAMLVILEKRGYIERHRHHQDGRARVVKITQA